MLHSKHCLYWKLLLQALQEFVKSVKHPEQLLSRALQSVCALASEGCTGAKSEWRSWALKSAWWCYIILGSLHFGKSTASSSHHHRAQFFLRLWKGGLSITFAYETPQWFCCWSYVVLLHSCWVFHLCNWSRFSGWFLGCFMLSPQGWWVPSSALAIVS